MEKGRYSCELPNQPDLGVHLLIWRLNSDSFLGINWTCQVSGTGHCETQGVQMRVNPIYPLSHKLETVWPLPRYLRWDWSHLHSLFIGDSPGKVKDKTDLGVWQVESWIKLHLDLALNHITRMIWIYSCPYEGLPQTFTNMWVLITWDCLGLEYVYFHTTHIHINS